MSEGTLVALYDYMGSPMFQILSNVSRVMLDLTDLMKKSQMMH